MPGERGKSLKRYAAFGRVIVACASAGDEDEKVLPTAHGSIAAETSVRSPPLWPAQEANSRTRADGLRFAVRVYFDRALAADVFAAGVRNLNIAVESTNRAVAIATVRSARMANGSRQLCLLDCRR